MDTFLWFLTVDFHSFSLFLSLPQKKLATKGGKKKKQVLKFTLDCTHPVEDGIMDAANFVSSGLLGFIIVAVELHTPLDSGKTGTGGVSDIGLDYLGVVLNAATIVPECM